MTKKKTDSEQPTDNESFEQPPMGGDGAVTRKKHDQEHLSPYHILVQEMRERADHVSYDSKEKILTKSLKKNLGTKRYPEYVDALISSRPVIDVGDKGVIPAVYVHTFAVRNMFDEAGSHTLSSLADIGGYYIQLGFPEPVGFFVKTTDRELIKKFHADILNDLKHGITTVKVSENFAERHKRDVAEKGGALVLFQSSLALPAPLYRSPHERSESHLPKEDIAPFGIGILESRFDVHTEFTRDEYHSKFDELRRRSMQTRHEGDKPEMAEYQGILLPRRMVETPERKADIHQFIHDMISAMPGGVFVYTRAIGPEDEREPLTSPREIKGYFLSLYFFEHESMIRINSGDPELVKMIHQTAFTHMRERSGTYALNSDSALLPGAQTLPKKILIKDVIEDSYLQKQKSDIDGVKPLVEFLK